MLFLPKCATIINNTVKCWNRPWQYGCNRPNALPSGRAFFVYRYGGDTNDDAKQGEKGTKDNTGNTGNTPAGDTSGNSTTATKTQAASDSSAYEPSGTYSPKKLTQKSLVFTKVEGQIIDALVGQDDLCNKIHDLVFELYKLDLNVGSAPTNDALKTGQVRMI